MSSTVELVLRTTVLAAIVASALTASWARRGRHRWGREPGPAAVVGAGAYRRGIVRSWVPRKIPLVVAMVAGAGVAWGLVTTIVFAPGGLVFLLAPVRHEPSTQLLLALSALGAWGASVSGFPLGVSLIACGHALLTRDEELAERAVPIAAWSMVHHACVLLAFTLFAVHERDPRIAIAVSIPCALGMLHAAALAHVAREVASMPIDDSTREP
jgi:hypothetical protein